MVKLKLIIAFLSLFCVGAVTAGNIVHCGETIRCVKTHGGNYGAGYRCDMKGGDSDYFRMQPGQHYFNQQWHQIESIHYKKFQNHNVFACYYVANISLPREEQQFIPIIGKENTGLVPNFSAQAGWVGDEKEAFCNPRIHDCSFVDLPIRTQRVS